MLRRHNYDVKLLTKLNVVLLRRTLNIHVVILRSGSVNERRDITSRFCDIILRDDKLT